MSMNNEMLIKVANIPCSKWENEGQIMAHTFYYQRADDFYQADWVVRATKGHWYIAEVKMKIAGGDHPGKEYPIKMTGLNEKQREKHEMHYKETGMRTLFIYYRQTPDKQYISDMYAQWLHVLDATQDKKRIEIKNDAGEITEILTLYKIEHFIKGERAINAELDRYAKETQEMDNAIAKNKDELDKMIKQLKPDFDPKKWAEELQSKLKMVECPKCHIQYTDLTENGICIDCYISNEQAEAKDKKLTERLKNVPADKDWNEPESKEDN